MELVPVLNSNSALCPSGCQTKYKKAGHFLRLWDRRRIQRYRCLTCGKYFSDSTHEVTFGQHKPYLNFSILLGICSSVALRRLALNLNANRKTIVRKSLFLASGSEEYLKTLSKRYKPVSEVQFDDMETHEHTKCKPLSITLAVVNHKRLILGIEVSTMPAKGKLASISRKKYGFRPDKRAEARVRLFEAIKPMMTKQGVIWSDKSPHYPEDVRKHFPEYVHKTCKGRRGCVVGQGELKRGGSDPLFTLNHTAGMIRDNLKRLARRTWCTTKRPDRLHAHLMIYAFYHNEFLLKKPCRKVKEAAI